MGDAREQQARRQAGHLRAPARLSLDFVGPALYSLTALGLFYRVPLAGFVAWFIFIGPGTAEFTHFIFPLLQPALHAHVHEPISQVVSNGNFVADMKNYWLQTTGTYYFPGMYTAVLPMIPGIWAIVRTFRHARAEQAGAAPASTNLSKRLTENAAS